MLDRKKRFSWSWSKLKNFRSCPKRHWHVDIVRTSRRMRARRCCGATRCTTRWPSGSPRAHPCRPPCSATTSGRSVSPRSPRTGITLKVENKLAMDEQFRPGVVLRQRLRGSAASSTCSASCPATARRFTIDWKTGNKVQPEFEQLALSSQVLFSHYPRHRLGAGDLCLARP